MEGITITISGKFHSLLKSNGMKGEKYEHIIVRLIKPEYSQDYKKFQSAETREKPQKPAIKAQEPLKKPVLVKLEKKVKSKLSKPKAFKNKPKLRLSTKIPRKIEKIPKSQAKQKKIPGNEQLNQWKYKKNLELQRLRTELELAKLSNDTVKIREMAIQLSKIKEELEQKK